MSDVPLEFSTFEPIDTVDAGTTTYQDTSASDGVTEVYEVAAYNTAATSSFSNTATASTPFAAPDNVTATAASTSEIDLSWINESQVATSFTILRANVDSSGNVGTYSTVATIANATTSTYADTDLPSGTTYSYEVQANEVTITSATSTAVTATTDLIVPTGLSVSTFNGISYDAPPSLTWSTVTGATGYAIERTDNQPNDGNWAIIGGSGGTGYEDEATTPGVTYNYRVVAYDNTDRSDPSTQATVTTSDVNPMYLPYIPGTPINNTSAQIAWPINSGDAGMTYTVQRWGPSDSTWTTIPNASNLSPQTSSYMATGLTPGDTYGFQVLATNSAGVTSMLVPGGVAMPNFQPPAPGSTYVSGITVSMAFGSANADVSPSGTDDTGLYQSDYIYITRNGGNLDAPITVPFQITGDGVYGTDFALSLPSGAASAGNAAVSLSGTGGTVAFSSGETTAVVELDPLNYTARSGKELTITAQSGSNYTLGTLRDDNGYLVPLPYSATESLAPHGLSIKLDQGEQYPIVSQSVEDTSTTTMADLMPLDINGFQNLPDGSTLELVDSQPSLTTVYGMVAGTLTALTTSTDGTIDWTTGSSTIPTQLAVAADADTGSSVVGNLLFQLIALPVSSTTHPNATTQTATTKQATVVPIGIVSNNNPNSDSTDTGDITGKTINWLVGQRVSLTATPTGPDAEVKGAKYKWKPDGNVDQTIFIANQGKTNPEYIPVGFDAKDAIAAGITPRQTTQQTTFFWVSTKDAAVSEMDHVDLTVTIGNKTFPVISTTFDVFEPTTVASYVVNPDAVGKNPAPAGGRSTEIGLVADDEHSVTDNSPHGIIWKAQVTTNQPAQGVTFKEGKYFFVQNITPNSTQKLYGDNHTYRPDYYGANQLDADSKHGGFPYPFTSPLASPVTQLATGTGPLYAWDNPYLSMFDSAGQPIAIQDAVATDSFKTYVMYTPPGPVNEVLSVPLQVLNWSYRVEAGFNRDNKGNIIPDIILAPGTKQVDTANQFVAATAEPKWTHATRSPYALKSNPAH